MASRHAITGPDTCAVPFASRAPIQFRRIQNAPRTLPPAFRRTVRKPEATVVRARLNSRISEWLAIRSMR